MTLKSMTAFARSGGRAGAWQWGWEIKSVNAKGLDLRLRVPAGFDPIEAEARARLSQRVARGTCYATLTAQRDAVAPQVRVNEAAMRAVIDALARLPQNPAVGPASLDGILQVRGIVDLVEASDDPAALAAAQQAMLRGLDEALDAFVAMRAEEGDALRAILMRRLDMIAACVREAEQAPGRQPEAIRARLAASIAALTGGAANLDPARLHQEALLLAAKADIREELDRLGAHGHAARALLATDTPVGRKLDFLAQELAREANTLCSKSNDTGLTAIGMALRVEIEQFREQVQNIE